MAVIRPAAPSDLVELERIESRSFSMPHWRGVSFLVYDCSVAEVDGKIAGFLVSRPVFQETGGQPSEREILNIAVDPAHRRKGVATALLRSELRHRGTHFLEVRESNLGAQKLYEKFGFKEVGRRAGYYDEPVEGAIVMRLK